MSLQLILGSSGAGKSHYLYTHIIEESMKNPDRNYIVVVPEQYTMAIQKRLVSMHPRKGILNIDVVSFERLAYKVFEEVGEDNLEVLDDTGKNLIIKRVLEQNKDRLKYFGSNLSNTGFVSEMKSVKCFSMISSRMLCRMRQVQHTVIQREVQHFSISLMI